MPVSRLRKLYDKITGLLISRRKPVEASPRGEKLRSRRAFHRDNVRSQQARGLEWRRNQKKITGKPRCKAA